jgi:hypothetical protein
MRSLRLTTLLGFFFVLCAGVCLAQQTVPGPIPEASVYNVPRLKKPMKIDAKWDKRQWKKVKPITINNFIREAPPKFVPVVQAKMTYDNENIYVIFHVQDKYVRSITKDFGAAVYMDSAAEFFFAPDPALPESYFNLEVNCGGMPTLGFRAKRPQPEDIKQIEIAHSLPQINDPEIEGPITWTLEYRIPLSMIEKYSKVARPQPGVQWRANFYKIAENNSNPHHASWSIIDPKKTLQRPTFHTPQFFGTLKFQ